jgi:hypothetical protein
MAGRLQIMHLKEVWKEVAKNLEVSSVGNR